MSLAHLAAGLEPIVQTRKTAQTNDTITCPTSDVSGCASLLIHVSYFPAIGVGSGPASILLTWQAVADNSLPQATDRLDVTAAWGNAVGDDVFIVAPVRAPWLQVVADCPTLSAGTATVEITIFGLHIPVPGLQWHALHLSGSADGAFTAPLDGGGPAVSISEPTRTPIAWTGVDLVTTAAEALQALDRSDNFAAVVNASTYTVPDGKLLTIESVVLEVRQPAAIGTCNVAFRLRTGNAVGGNLIYLLAGHHANDAAAAKTLGRTVPATLPRGLQVPAGQQFCFTQQETTAGVNTRFNIAIFGTLRAA